MSVWLVRAGARGEFEEKFIDENRIYGTWPGLRFDLGRLSDRADLVNAMSLAFPDSKDRQVRNWASQLWLFVRDFQDGDLVVLPRKSPREIYVGEVRGEYRFDAEAPDPFQHWRPVDWIGRRVPRTHFRQDLLYSFGSLPRICRIYRTDAEARLRGMNGTNWGPEPPAPVSTRPPGRPPRVPS